MKKLAHRVWLVLVVSISLVLPSFVLALTPIKADAAVSSWQKGVNVNTTYPQDFASPNFKKSIDNLATTGANYVTLVIPYKQSNSGSTDISPTAAAPDDASLIAGINYVHGKGMKVMLMPHLDPMDGLWRAVINPGDRNTWYVNYSAMLNHLGDIGKQTGVEEIAVGSELIDMAAATENADNTQRWQTMIASLKTHYSGSLTYGANWGGSGFPDEVDHIAFWPQLDTIGISAYYDLFTQNGKSDPATLEQDWNNIWEPNIHALNTKYGKPILFTEVGYRSMDGSNNYPWDWATQANYNAQQQADDYQALFEYWNSKSYMIGVHLWYWDTNPGAGGQGDTTYTPQNKPAQGVMTTWFGGGGTLPPINPPPTGTTTPPTTPPPSSQSGTWSSNASESGNQSGQSVNVNANVSITGSATNVITDLEIYNSSNAQVFQKLFANQNFSSNQANSYQGNWTPQANGTYTVKIGEFPNDWSSMYYWNDAVLKFSIGSTGTTTPPTGTTTPPVTPPPTSTSTPPVTPPPASVALDIWWPTDGSTIGGNQPFKAMLTNTDTSTYNMFWQVDGGQLNQMANNATDYAHKESLVDLSGWTWNKTGPYKVNFVAKDNSGTLIQQKAVNINVAK